MDLQNGNFPWTVWLKWTWWDEKEDQGWILRSWKTNKGVEKVNQGMGGCPGAGSRSKWCLKFVANFTQYLTLNLSNILHHWDCRPSSSTMNAKHATLWIYICEPPLKAPINWQMMTSGQSRVVQVKIDRDWSLWERHSRQDLLSYTHFFKRIQFFYIFLFGTEIVHMYRADCISVCVIKLV